MIRSLRPGDENALERFLVRHSASSMFLRSNARRGGLRYAGEAFQADWVAAFAGADVVGVAAHCWNGMLLLQAPAREGELARAAVAASGRQVDGLAGPRAQVRAVRSALELAERPAQMDSEDDLFHLDLADLRDPPVLDRGDVEVRRAEPHERETAVAWRMAYRVELLGDAAGPALRADSEREIDASLASGDAFFCHVAGRPEAFSGFNARIPDCVQVGGVYTPPARRGRGWARCAVAGSLRIAREEGAREALLFTGAENEPARRVYFALGFRVVGDYQLVLF